MKRIHKDHLTQGVPPMSDFTKLGTRTVVDGGASRNFIGKGNVRFLIPGTIVDLDDHHPVLMGTTSSKATQKGLGACFLRCAFDPSKCRIALVEFFVVEGFLNSMRLIVLCGFMR